MWDCFNLIIIPPAQRSCLLNPAQWSCLGGILVSLSPSVRPSVCLSVHPSHIPVASTVLFESISYLYITGNHYKWDWPKSQFCMLSILAIIDWLRNLKVVNIYFFNILQNTLKISSFSKLEIRKLKNLIFPSSAEPCRILQNSALVPQNSAEHFGEKLRNSADFCRILQNSAE